MSAHNKRKTRFPLKRTVAVLAAAWVAASFILHLPPASWMQHVADHESGTTAEEAPTKPFPNKPPFRFGSRALAGVCIEYGLDVDSAVQELEGFAIAAKPEWSIKRIAQENDMETAALFEVIREVSLDRMQQSDMLD